MEEIQVNAKMFLGYFKEMVIAHPQQDALLGENEYGQQFKVTYKDLDDKSNQLAHYLISLGLKAPRIVALVFDKSNPDWVVSFLAIWKAGCAVLLIGRELTNEEAAYRIRNVKASAIITDLTDNIDFLESTETKICFGLSSPEIRKHSCSAVEDVNVTLDHLAYIAYTSGTTADSKAIAINHRGIMPITLAHKEILETKLGERMLQYSKFSFDASYMELLMIGVGVSLVLESASEGMREKPEHYIKKYQINLGIFVPSMLNKLKPKELTSLRAIVSTGEAGNEVLFDLWRSEGTPRIVVNGYGPAECTIGVMLAKYAGGEITLGKAISRTRVVLLEKKENKEALIESRGVVGKSEIGIMGDSVGRGYVKDGEVWKEKTDQVFVTIDRERVYRTGDLGHYNKDGYLICDGRKDRQFKIFGMRVEAQAIEDVLRKVLSLDGVDVAVVPRYRSKNDKTIKCLEAFILTDAPSLVRTDIKTIRCEMMKSRLFKAAVPVKFYVIKKDKAFYNEKCDKLKYKKLAEKLDDESFLRANVLPFSNQNLDRSLQNLTETEKKIEAVWRAMLPIPEEFSIDIEKDEFCHWGGNSLLELELMEKLQEVFSQSAPINFREYPVFKGPLTIENLACDIARRSVYGKKCWQRIGVSGDPLKPPVFLFHSILGTKREFESLADRLGDDQIVYVLRDPLTLSSEKQSEQLKDYKRKYKCETIEEIASYAIHAMLKNNPGKHYFIGGFSFGGVIACEAVSQLQKMKKEVMWLGLIEPPVLRELSNSLTGKNSGVKKIRQILIMCSQMILNVDNKFMSVTLADDEVHFDPEVKIIKLFERLKKDVQKLHADELCRIEEFELVISCVERNFSSLVKYNPPKYLSSGSNVFLYFSEELPKVYEKRWHESFTVPINTRSDISCEHPEMLRNERLQEVVREDLKNRLGSLSSTSYLDHLASFKSWHIPEAYPHFVGRKDELEAIWGDFENPEVMTFAICGFGGLGKSRLAQVFVEQCIAQKKYEIVAWFKVDESLEKSIQDFLYEKFKIRHDNNISRETLVELFYQKLSQLDSALIVFDDVTKAEQLKNIIKDNRDAHIKILVTSRENNWPKIKGYKTRDIGKIGIANAVNFIKKHIEAKDDKIEKLAKYLACYPLALHQAVGFLSSHPSMPIEEYVRLLESCETQLLDEMGDIIDKQYQKTLVSIVMVSLQGLDVKKHPHIKSFLIQLSMLNPDRVSESMLQLMLQPYCEGLTCQEVDLKCRIYIDYLKKYGFITEHNDGVKMHPVIQRIIVDLEQDEQKKLLLKTIHALLFGRRSFNKYNEGHFCIFEHYFLDLIKVFSLYMKFFKHDNKAEHEFVFILLVNFVQFLTERRNDEETIAFAKKLIVFFEAQEELKSLPYYHLELISLYSQFLRPEFGIKLLTSHLTSFEKKIKAANHNASQVFLNRIKYMLFRIYDDKEVKRILIEELVKSELNNIEYLHAYGRMICSNGQPEKGYPWLAEAARLSKATTNFEDILERNIQYPYVLNSLALCCVVMGRYKEAKEVSDEAFEMIVRYSVLYGATNQKVKIKILASRFSTLFEIGEYSEALYFFDRYYNSHSENDYEYAIIRIMLYNELALYTKFKTLVSRTFLKVSTVYKFTLSLSAVKYLVRTGKYAEAEKWLDILKKFTDPYRILLVKLDFIYVYFQQKKIDQSIAIIEEVVRECYSNFKVIQRHFICAKALFYLGKIAFVKGDLQLSRDMLRDALAMQTEAYEGLMHPDLAETYRELATVEMLDGNFTEAHELLSIALKYQFNAFGPNPHPEIAKTYLVYSRLAWTEKNIPEALEMQKFAEECVNVELIDPSIAKLVQDNRAVIDSSKQFFGDPRSASMLMFSPADNIHVDNNQTNQERLKPSSPNFNNNNN